MGRATAGVRNCGICPHADQLDQLVRKKAAERCPRPQRGLGEQSQLPQTSLLPGRAWAASPDSLRPEEVRLVINGLQVVFEITLHYIIYVCSTFL